MDLILSQVAQGQAEVMFATHNEDCVKYGVKRMQEIGIKPDDGSVLFAQLYGMCDHVSYALGKISHSLMFIYICCVGVMYSGE
jgi:proline dehydrogenase